MAGTRSRRAWIFRREQFDTLVGNVGAYVFASTFTSSSNAPGSGLPYADYLFGYPTSVSGTPMLNWGNQRAIAAPDLRRTIGRSRATSP